MFRKALYVVIVYEKMEISAKKGRACVQNSYLADRGVYFYLFRDIHPGTVYEFLRIPEKFWMTHSMPKTFPEVMNIMLNVNCITKTFLEFQTLTESVYSIHS